MGLEECLPPELQTTAPIITKIGVGQSGAGVYRVEAAGQAFVLKTWDAAEPVEAWRARRAILEQAAEAGIAPRVVHVDEGRRAVLSVFVVDRSFPAYLMDPRTRDAATELLGRTLRRAHALPVPAIERRDPRALLGRVGTTVMPGFARAAVDAMVAEEPPPAGRPEVLAHNDVNPTNLVFDGTNLFLLDWDMAGPNDPFYDLAAISVFLRFDDAACLQLLAAYDGTTELPDRFRYDRRLAAIMCGAIFLMLARHSGYTGAADETSAPSLLDVYGRMRTGALDLNTPGGRWQLGLALIDTGRTLTR